MKLPTAAKRMSCEEIEEKTLKLNTIMPDILGNVFEGNAVVEKSMGSRELAGEAVMNIGKVCSIASHITNTTKEERQAAFEAMGSEVPHHVFFNDEEIGVVEIYENIPLEIKINVVLSTLELPCDDKVRLVFEYNHDTKDVLIATVSDESQ